MRAHIINCSEEILNSFLNEGFIAVGVATPKENTSGSKRAALFANYSMIADMKAVKRGDIIFIHVGQKIHGIFEAATEFLENPDCSRFYKSENLKYALWENNRTFPAEHFVRQIAIKPHKDLCFEKGFDSEEVFKLKSAGKVWTVPDRWKYTDASRTVRPLTPIEANELKTILLRENVEGNLRTFSPKDLSGFNKLSLMLEPQDSGKLANEKILESWILDNLTLNGDNQSEYENITRTIGRCDYFGNNIPAFYLNFIDIFGYVEKDEEILKYKVIELKRDGLTDSNWNSDKNELKQLINYLDWVVKIKAKGDSKKVEGVLVAKRFSDKYKHYVKERSKVESGNRIRLVAYDVEENRGQFNVKLNLID
ncbi:hypothetical protein HYX10_02135 [Candidatus Woesearchaeota archaeon]|nr:hypothetical protein [Candidatus Woesearchaeota archaeon]